MDPQPSNYILQQTQSHIMSELETADKFYAEGKYPKAYAAYKQYVECLLSRQDDSWLELSTVYQKLGVAALESAKFSDAHTYLNQALEIRRETEKGESLIIGEIMKKIGEAHLEEGKLYKAEETLQEALRIVLKSGGQDHVSVASCYNRLGHLRGIQHRYKEAIEYINKAIAITEKDISQHKTELFISYNSMARFAVYLKIDELPSLFVKKASEMIKTSDIQSHPEKAMLDESIGITMYMQEHFDEALISYNDSLNTYLHLLGQFHPKVANLYNSIGLTYFCNGELEDAFENFQKGEQIWRKYFNHDSHIIAARTYFYQLSLYMDTGCHDLALDLLKKCSSICLKLSQEGYQTLARDPCEHFHRFECITATDCYLKLLDIHSKQGNSVEVEAYAEKYIDLYIKCFEDKSKQLGEAYKELALLHEKHKNLKKTVECYLNSSKVLDTDFTIMYSLMDIFAKMNDLKSGDPIRLKYIQLRIKSLGKTHGSIGVRKIDLIEKQKCIGDNNCDIML